MTTELMERKWPIGTRIKIVETDLFGTKKIFKGTVIGSYSEYGFCVKMDNGIMRRIWPKEDHFSVIYHEQEEL